MAFLLSLLLSVVAPGIVPSVAILILSCSLACALVLTLIIGLGTVEEIISLVDGAYRSLYCILAEHRAFARLGVWVAVDDWRFKKSHGPLCENRRFNTKQNRSVWSNVYCT